MPGPVPTSSHPKFKMIQISLCHFTSEKTQTTQEHTANSLPFPPLFREEHLFSSSPGLVGGLVLTTPGEASICVSLCGTVTLRVPQELHIPGCPLASAFQGCECRGKGPERPGLPVARPWMPTHQFPSWLCRGSLHQGLG